MRILEIYKRQYIDLKQNKMFNHIIKLTQQWV